MVVNPLTENNSNPALVETTFDGATILGRLFTANYRVRRMKQWTFCYAGLPYCGNLIWCRLFDVEV